MSATLRMSDDDQLRIGVVDGDVDLASARDLTSEILNGVPHAVHGLLLDLSRVRYLDSTGVSMLLEVHRSLDSRRQRFIVVLPRTSHLWRVFEITGLPSILRIAESVEDGKQAAVAP